MYKFAWSIVLAWNKKINLEFDYVENFSKDWNKVVFIFGETDVKKSEDLVEALVKKLWFIKYFDISISSEDKLEILNDTYEEWIYELVTFEWEDVDFKEIKERFIDTPEVISIRESDVSEKFWNRKIKVDFVY